jgi:DNA-binding SARP family transcriptional activator
MFQLQAFGEPVLFNEGGGYMEAFPRQTKRLALLVYLACDGQVRPHRRDAVAAMFWPEADQEHGRNALRQAIHVIRENLGKEVLLCNGGQELRVNRRVLQSDVARFSKAVAHGSYETALSLHRNDFLLGFFISGAMEFEGWVEHRRARLRRLASCAAVNLARSAEGKRSLSDALYWWRRAMEVQPLDEFLLRRVLTLVAYSGNRSVALMEFERFRRLLLSELDVEPSPQTVELAEKIASGALDDIPQWIGNRRYSDARAHGKALGRRVTDLAFS